MADSLRIVEDIVGIEGLLDAQETVVVVTVVLCVPLRGSESGVNVVGI